MTGEVMGWPLRGRLRAQLIRLGEQAGLSLRSFWPLCWGEGIGEEGVIVFPKFPLQPGLCAVQRCSPEIRAGSCCFVAVWDTLLYTCRNETCVNQHKGEIINYSQRLLDGNVRKEG